MHISEVYIEFIKVTVGLVMMENMVTFKIAVVLKL